MKLAMKKGGIITLKEFLNNADGEVLAKGLEMAAAIGEMEIMKSYLPRIEKNRNVQVDVLMRAIKDG